MPETTENGTNRRYETVLNAIHKEHLRIKESQEKLLELAKEIEKEHPAPAAILNEAAIVIGLALNHVKGVFTDF